MDTFLTKDAIAELKQEYQNRLNNSRADYLKKLKNALGNEFVNLEEEEKIKAASPYSYSIGFFKTMHPLQREIMTIFDTAQEHIDTTAKWKDADRATFNETIQSHSFVLKRCLNNYPEFLKAA